MTYKLFIDDERTPVTKDWIIARSSEEAIQIVSDLGFPREIAFDHDLGNFGDTSRIFINWLIDQLLDEDMKIPDDFIFSVHSQNPIGASWITSTMKGIIQEFS